ncbi:hypothetical protein, partial [Colwellia sp. MEBiC06753]
LGLLQCKINNMQMMTMPQRPSYKGNPHLRVRPHVGVIALGNAVGNSIVSGLSKSPQPSKEDLERQAKLDAMSRQLGQDAS